jgi:hypothetical protein
MPERKRLRGGICPLLPALLPESYEEVRTARRVVEAP